TDIKVFVKIEGAWVAGGDLAQLQAGGGECEHLGRGGNIERLEQADDKSLAVFVVERDFPRFKIVFEFGERIVQWAGVVFMGWREQVGAIGGRLGTEAELDPCQAQPGEHRAVGANGANGEGGGHGIRWGGVGMKQGELYTARGRLARSAVVVCSE